MVFAPVSTKRGSTDASAPLDDVTTGKVLASIFVLARSKNPKSEEGRG